MAQRQTQNDLADHHATISVDIPRSRLVLLGTFGAEGTRGALLRLPDGKVEKVASGDTVLGQRVVAIADTDIMLARGPNTKRLKIPGN